MRSLCAFTLSFLFIFNFTISQTHFTIPQNVWRISLKQDITSGKWKGHDGNDGWVDYRYTYKGLNYVINQYWEQTRNTQSIMLEYGLTNKSTFSLLIPKHKEINQTHSWTISSGVNEASLDSIMTFYFPKTKSNSGLGNVMIGMKTLLIGNPVWREGKGKYSIYGGLDVTFPFGERLVKYYPKEIDVYGVPHQFKQLPISNGLLKWRGTLFGELYRYISRRLININWSINGAKFSREKINPPLSFLWTENTNIDSISSSIGNDVLHESGFEISGSIQGQLEVIPQKLFTSAGIHLVLSGKDIYFSRDKKWDSWMASRKNFDTQRTAISQYIKINMLNLDPFKQIGPIPFEMELGVRWFLPYLTYHTYGYTSMWVQISSYFQAW